jgi:serine/threonine protein kinase
MSGCPYSDVFTAGAVIYEVLTGKPIRDYPKRRDVIRPEIMKNRPAPIQEIHPTIPELIADVVDKALDMDPKRRCRHAGEMYRALALVAPTRTNLVVKIKCSCGFENPCSNDFCNQCGRAVIDE